ncbi:MAG: hypothetical protein JWN52_479 [Actinomycetia bacterium]|nr:hypothetical protein [Actinomycetes bacterium]
MNDRTHAAPPVEGDQRFTHGLIYDVFKVLEAHGYTRPDDSRSTAVAMLALGRPRRGVRGRERVMTRTLVTVLYVLASIALVATVALWVALLISGCWGVALVSAFPKEGAS